MKVYCPFCNRMMSPDVVPGDHGGILFECLNYGCDFESKVEVISKENESEVRSAPPIKGASER